MNNPTHLDVKYPKGTTQVAANFRPGESNDLLVFLHGFGCAKESFDGAFSDDRLADHSLLAFDWLGHGESRRPSNFRYSMKSHAEIGAQVVNQIRQKEHERLTVVAHSMGGAIGLLMSKQVKVDNFINIEGNLVAEDAGIVSRQTAEQSDVYFSDCGYSDFLTDLQESGRTDMQAWGSWYKKASPDALHRSARSLVTWSDNGLLLRYFCMLPKATYIFGDDDSKKYLLDNFSSSVAHRQIANSGHFVMVDQPQELYSVVADSLKA